MSEIIPKVGMACYIDDIQREKYIRPATIIKIIKSNEIILVRYNKVKPIEDCILYKENEYDICVSNINDDEVIILKNEYSKQVKIFYKIENKWLNKFDEQLYLGKWSYCNSYYDDYYGDCSE